MIKFLNSFGLACVLAVGIAFIAGYFTAESVSLETHVVIGLTAALATILYLSLLMFYFIGTGSVAKKAAIAKFITMDEYNVTRKTKGMLFPIIMGVIVVLLVQPALGAAYDAGKLDLIWHHAFSWIAFVFLIYAIMKSRKMMKENFLIFEKSLAALNEEAEKNEPAEEEAPTTPSE